jgi:hypothetical protein
MNGSVSRPSSATEDITTALSKVWWFSVAARNSAFAYKAKAVDVRGPPANSARVTCLKAACGMFAGGYLQRVPPESNRRAGTLVPAISRNAAGGGHKRARPTVQHDRDAL